MTAKEAIETVENIDQETPKDVFENVDQPETKENQSEETVLDSEPIVLDDKAKAVQIEKLHVDWARIVRRTMQLDQESNRLKEVANQIDQEIVKLETPPDI